jgi:hypothetical protein
MTQQCNEHSLSNGQGVTMKCKCNGNCDQKRCTCFGNGWACSDPCHPSHPLCCTPNTERHQIRDSQFHIFNECICSMHLKVEIKVMR